MFEITTYDATTSTTTDDAYSLASYRLLTRPRLITYLYSDLVIYMDH